MVDKKLVCLYVLNHDTGKICYIMSDLYIFGDDYESRTCIINIPFASGNKASYIDHVPELEGRIFRIWQRGSEYSMFWCNEPDSKKAVEAFECCFKDKLEDYHIWSMREMESMSKMLSMHQNGEGILPISEWRDDV